MNVLRQFGGMWAGTASWRLIWTAGLVTVAFTALARWLRGVSRSGAMAGAVVCFILYVSAGIGAFLALVSVFSLAWITTRFGYKHKQRLGTAERSEGRTASQVLANLSIATGCVAVFSLTGRAAYLVGFVAALAEAVADTVSSELGQASNEKARLITTWEEVPAGTDGGVTGHGTIGGMMAAVFVTLVCLASRLVGSRQLSICIIAALFGMMTDSYLGALLERRGLLNNDSVNFLGTLVAAGAAIALS